MASYMNPPKNGNPKSCMLKIDSIATERSFREAIIPAEKCVQENEKDVKLNLRLAGFYLLSYLVDNEEEGLVKASDQFSKTLKIDTSFVTNSSEFNMEKNRLLELKRNWFNIQKNNYEAERERILIWALIYNFDSEKEPK